ncbi:MAG TPA: NAD(P)/FAD-dependent oxidoreductase [Chitinophagaceae bacterium]|nr:NAD(P)/FAD-dependent oxidoreductase [Chitinophagaceae bacterium]
MSKHLIVIGGGAAGFFCAINAARMDRSLKVTIIEKSNKLLAKVKVSGGGRCNVTHACFDIAEMSKRYPRGQHFVKKAFHQFFTTDTIKWFEERGVKLKTEEDGRMFPVTDSSQTVIECLLKEANESGVEILMNREVKKINAQQSMFNVQCSNGEISDADFICIASGGYPKSSMFDWLKELGHTIEEPVPSLFTFNLPKHPITKLMGVSVERTKVKILPMTMGTTLEEEGPLLITHWGLSGPAVLKLSAWGARELGVKSYEFKVVVNWLPQFNQKSLKEKFHQLRTGNASQKVINKNVFGLPSRLWEFLAEQSGVKNEWRWADFPSSEQNRLIKNLCSYECEVRGKTTFKEEFVTAGGIKLSEVDANTMMSKKNPNLFFAGEVLDVDGITGGFNFQHAWTSGWVAAKAIAFSSDVRRES